MEVFDNITNVFYEDLKKELKKGSKLSIASACFSIFAYKELKKQLDGIDELRFIFTEPTFTTEKTPKEKREFYIPRLSRERNLYGTEFEVRLRNELNQKAIAKECAAWVKRKVTFKSNTTNGSINTMMNIGNGDDRNTYFPINGFTTADLGYDKGNNLLNFITKVGAPYSEAYLKMFDSLWNDSKALQDVTQEVVDSICAVYSENAPEFIYFVALYNIFNEFLDDITEDNLPNESTGFKETKIWNLLYDFQKDAVLGLISKLEKYNGAILADSVGLGKTYTALAVIKYYENRNKSVLVLCPKKLNDNWIAYRANLLNNPIAADRLRYDVLYHTDLSRDKGKSNGLPLEMINWSNYDLVVIDESHNFRNGGEIINERENRYLRLMNKVIRPGVKTKVLMLSATPVNNRFYDLKNQLALAYEGDSSEINKKLNIKRSIEDVFVQAQRAFNAWNKRLPEERTTESLLNALDFDFFEVLDAVTIARSRKHIQKYYNMDAIGKFPARNKPITLSPPLTDLPDFMTYAQLYNSLLRLNLGLYTPSKYLLSSCIGKYEDKYGRDMGNTFFKQSDREEGIRRLISINLLKRLESSAYSFRLTLKRIIDQIDTMLATIDRLNADSSVEIADMAGFGGDFEDDDEDFFSIGKKVKFDLRDIDVISWRRDLEEDKFDLAHLFEETSKITPKHDLKLQKLFEIIADKIKHPINPGNKKVLIFSAFSDTAEYLYREVSAFAKQHFGLNSAMITGNVEGRSTISGLKTDLNTVLTCFSPKSKQRALLGEGVKNDIDILIATDCISEGQNLQDCDYLINYDIHWNPVRIIQRFGRIDRIGSTNNVIQLVNFWPDISLDEYINLKSRVETRMKISVMTASGDENPISPEEKGDLEYRKQQLQRLQTEIVDLEDMAGGINITDLGLNEFRMDLVEYMKNNPTIDQTPFGLHAVVEANDNCPAGVIFVLKNISKEINIDKQNRIHPFYMVYMRENGTVVCDHLSPKKMLDIMRLSCRGKNIPDKELCSMFNQETDDGKNMREYSRLLEQAVDSIIHVKEENDMENLFKEGGLSSLISFVRGIDDFELICFLAIKDKKSC